MHHFQLIAENPPRDASDILAPGGWHDAADYDRCNRDAAAKIARVKKELGI